MATDIQQLDTMQTNYKAATERWITSIRHEEELAAHDHSVIEVDAWEQAGFDEENLRNEAKSAKKQYEDALRQQFYGFHGK